jgi:hypothetical protein
VDKLQEDDDCTTPLDTIKKHPIAFVRSMQSTECSSSSGIKKALFGIQRNMSVPNVAESNVPGLIKKQSTLSSSCRGTPPPVPPNKPIIPPKKNLVNFIKQISVTDNAVATTAAATADKEQKDSLLRHNNYLSNDIAAVDKQEETVEN